MLKIIEDTNGREAALGISVRVAGASYGEPVCVEPSDARDESLSVSLYVKGGAIVGVVVLDPFDSENDGVHPALYKIGLVPGDDTEDRENPPVRS